MLYHIRWTAVLCLSLTITQLHAQNSWFLHANSANWNNLADWYSDPAGGTNPSAFSSTDTYHLNGYELRSPSTTTNVAFGGGALVINGRTGVPGGEQASGSILIKMNSSTLMTTIPNLVARGGPKRTISNGTGGNQILQIGTFTVATDEVTTFSTGGATRGLNITVGTLQGNGDLNFIGAGTTMLNISFASNYYGTIFVTAVTTLSVQNNIATSGALVVESGSKVILNGNLNVTGLTVEGTTTSTEGLLKLRSSGTVYGNNTTYTFAELNAAFPAVFTEGSGSITVTQPKLKADAAVVVDSVGVGQLGANLDDGKFWNALTPDYGGDLKKARMGMLRVGGYPKNGTETVGILDMRVAQALNAGCQPQFIQLIDTAAHKPAFVAALYDVDGNLGTGGTVATNMAFLVKRYKAPPYNLTTQYWEIGNEPDISINYQVANPAEYIAFYQSCHDQLVASGVRENVILCGPTVAFEYGFAANGNRTDNILNAFLPAVAAPRNGYNQVDVVTRHVYPALYDWETDAPDPVNNPYNYLNHPCEMVTFTQAHSARWPYRGEAALQAKMNSLGIPSTVGTGVTELQVSDIYRHTITQGLWFLIYDHFALYNPRNVLSAGFVYPTTSHPMGYYNSSKLPSFSYWASYIHGVLTGDEVLSQSSSDPHLLVTATKDDSYVYLRVLNRNTVDMTASVSLSNAPIAGSATLFQLTDAITPELGTPTALGASFSYTFPAMTARVFRYPRSDAPTPVTPPAPPANVVLNTDFTAAPAGMLTYHTVFQPVVTAGNLRLTSNVANATNTVIFNGQPLAAPAQRAQVKFGFRVDSGHAGTGFVFGAYSANPGAHGAAANGLGYFGQPNRLWGVKFQNKGATPDQMGIVGSVVNSTIDGWANRAIPPYYAMDLFVVIDYEGTAGTVRSRLYQGTDETGVLFGDITNRLANPSALPTGTVFGFASSTQTFAEITLIQHLSIAAGNADSIAPTVSIIAPTNGATVSGSSVGISANAGDNAGVVGVQFRLDGVNLGSEDTSAPYNLAWNTTGVSNGVHILTAVARDAAGNSTTSSNISVTVSNSAGALPAPWVDQNVGSVGLAGNSSYSGGTFTVAGSGGDISATGTSDAFKYVYQPANGDCTITARVTSITNTNSGAKAGVMIRETLTGNAARTMTYLTPSGLGFIYRATAGAVSASASGGAGVAPYWVRAVRAGNSFSAFKSTDGITWTQIGTTQTITMGASVHIGLAVTSKNNALLNTATFDSVSVTP